MFDLVINNEKKPNTFFNFSGARVSEVDSSSCQLSWLLPETHHSCLRGFQILVRSSNGADVNEVNVMANMKKFTIKELHPCQDYEIELSAICHMDKNDTKTRTESEATIVSLATLPEKVQKLWQENSTPNSLTVKWDAPVTSSNLKYKLTISGVERNTAQDKPDNNENVEFQRLESTISTATTTTQIQTKWPFHSTAEVPGDKNQHTFSKV